MATVHIVEVASGKTAKMEEPIWPGDATEYLWTDGNYSCDCNRALFVHGKDSDDTECSEGRYRIWVTDGDAVVYDDRAATP